MYFSCFGCRQTSSNKSEVVVEDNCCGCNLASVRQILSLENVEIIHASYHVDVGQTPFFVAVDNINKKLIISIRGTLSMKVRQNSSKLKTQKAFYAHNELFQLKSFPSKVNRG